MSKKKSTVESRKKNAEQKRKAYENMSQEQRSAYLAMKRRYSKDNKKRKTAYRNEYNKNNREKVNEVQRNWRSRNKDKLKVCRKKWLSKEENRIRIRNQALARQAKKRASPTDVKLVSKWEFDWKSMDKCTCAFCLKEMPSRHGEVEHFYPLSRGGGHRLSNLSIACRDCNARKHARNPFDFIRGIVYDDYDTLYENTK